MTNHITDYIEKNYSNQLLKEEIKNSGIPLVLYGAAEGASYLYKNFIQDGVYFDEIVVDSDLLSKTESTAAVFHQQPLVSVESLKNKYKSVNIVIGFYESDFEKIQKRIRNLKHQGLVINKVYLPDISLIISPERVFDINYIYHNQDEFQRLYLNLSDDLSRKVLIAYINQRINMQLGYLRGLQTINQYFPDDIFQYSPQEVFVDCGAYNGDTVEHFLCLLRRRKIVSFDSIYAFEPDVSNFNILSNKYKEANNIYTINQGLWSSKTQLRFRGGKQMMSMLVPNGDTTVNVISIDQALDKKRASFIKMDIQGSELEALKGAEKTILRSSPKLAICVYHKKEDLITIPEFIKSLEPKYKLYLRAHELKAAEIVLYATV